MMLRLRLLKGDVGEVAAADEYEIEAAERQCCAS
jgi:hypothetical protein